MMSSVAASVGAVLAPVGKVVKKLIFIFEKSCFCRNAAAIVGTFVIGRVVVRHLGDIVRGFRAFFLAPMGLGRMNLRKYGNWAVVTGASEGIGRGYALELARQGLNVVLMSRSQQKLSKVADEIREQYGRDTRVVPVDFSGGLDIYTMISDHIKDLDVGVLVNNVGVVYDYPDILDRVSAESLYNVAHINCQPVVQMSRLLLPKMVVKGGGVIVNLSSLSLLQVLPELTVYSATKIYIKYISDGIRKEYGSKGIVVQTVTPSFVTTKMTDNVRSLVPHAKPIPYARAAVATIGIQDNTFGCFYHAVQGYILGNSSLLYGLVAAYATRQGRADYMQRQAQKTN